MTATTNHIDLPALQRKVRNVLVLGQIMAGLGMGATLSMGAILAGRLSGSDAWSGMAASVATLGAAVAAIPLARLAARYGRRVSLTTGALVASVGAVTTIYARHHCVVSAPADRPHDDGGGDSGQSAIPVCRH